MTGFFNDGLLGNPTGAVQFYDEAIQALEWGRQAWRNVTKEKRGAIFEDTFLRGVRCLRFDCFMKVCVGILIHLQYILTLLLTCRQMGQIR